MAKRVQISDDAGSTWFTLPGNSGELSQDAGTIDDSIFGQEFSSGQAGLINWSINANAIYKGFSGYMAKILKTGTTTTMTAEAMTLVSGKTYRITNAAKNVWDRTATWIVYGNGVAISSANIESIDYLFGRVTFAAAYTPTTPITVTGKYFPMSALGCTNGFTLTQTTNPIDESCMDSVAANDGHKIFNYGLKTATLDINGVYRVANGFRELLVSRAEVMVEINPDGQSKSICRGWFKATSIGQSGDLGNLEQETVSFALAVPVGDEIPYPLHWIHASDSTIPVAISKCLAAWEAKDLINVRYLPDGIDGYEGEGVLTDLTLTGGLEVMNEFAVNVQGSGELETYTAP